MKNLIIKVILTFLFFPSTLLAQWVQTNGPSSVYVYQMAVTGSKIYVNAHSNGIYVSTNGGANWAHSVSQLPPQLYLLCIAAKGDTVFVGSREPNIGTQGGIYFTSNRGVSWSLVLPMTPDQRAGGILINGGHVIASGVSNSVNVVYLSSNFGMTWDTIFPGSAVGSALLANGNVIYGGSGNGVSISTDNGLSWTLLQNSPSNVHALAIKDNIIFAGTYGELIFKSTDGGNSWQQSGSGIPSNRRINSFAVVGNSIFASTYVVNYGLGGVFKSSDNGNNWNLCGLNLMQVGDLGVIGNNLLAGTGFGVFLSTDNGSSWSTSNAGFPFLDVNIFCSSYNRFFASDGTLFYTTNGGTTWTLSNYRGSQVKSLYSDGSRIVVGTYNTLVLSTDNGENFFYVSGGFVGAPSIVAVAALGNSIVSGNHWNFNNTDALCVTTNNGSNWSSWGCPLSINVHAFAVSSPNIFAATGSGVFLSSNGGFNWTIVSSGLPTADILSIAAQGNLIIAGTNGAGPYISTNNGTNWSPINSGISSSSVFAMVIKGNSVFAGTNGASNMIYFSSNYGSTWNPIDGNLSGYSIVALGADSLNLYASTGSQAGVWKRLLSEITGFNSNGKLLPNKFSLYQNYPNPFNPVTKISYDLPSSGYVKLIIYDVMGREMKTLVNEKENAGSYEVEFDGSNYPSGVYYYKLTTDSYSATKKLVLIK